MFSFGAVNVLKGVAFKQEAYADCLPAFIIFFEFQNHLHSLVRHILALMTPVTQSLLLTPHITEGLSLKPPTGYFILFGPIPANPRPDVSRIAVGSLVCQVVRTEPTAMFKSLQPPFLPHSDASSHV